MTARKSDVNLVEGACLVVVGSDGFIVATAHIGCFNFQLTEPLKCMCNNMSVSFIWTDS